MNKLELEAVVVPGQLPEYMWHVYVNGYKVSDGQAYVSETQAVAGAVGYLFTEMDRLDDRIRSLENR
jgi:hypothetical protein